MAAKKKKKQHAQTAEGRVVRFFKHHWLGISMGLLLTAGASWIAWSVQGCLNDQKTQLAAARKAWTNVRITNQKTVSDREALVTREELFVQDVQKSATRAMLDTDEKAMFNLFETFNADCNAFKNSMYEVAREMKALGRSFSFDFDFEKDYNISALCEGMAEIAEKWRNPSLGKSGLPDQDIQSWLTKGNAEIKRQKAIILALRLKEREANSWFEDKFVSLEKEGTFRRVGHCLRP